MKKLYIAFILSLGLISLLQAQPLSGNYSIINGAVTSGTVFGSITDAVDTLNKYGVSAPVVFTISNGTYIGNYHLPAISGASTTNTITFKAGIGQAPVLSYTASSWSDNYIFLLDSTAHLRFEGLTFTPTCPNGGSGAATYTCSFQLINASNLNYGIEDLQIQQCIFNGKTDPDYGNETDQIHCYGPAVKDVLIANNQFTDGAIAIGLFSNYPNIPSRNITITNNNIQLANNGFTEAAIAVTQADSNVVITSNTVTGSYSQAIAVQNASGRTIHIETNHIQNTGWEAIALQTSSAKDVVISNNVISNTSIGIHVSNCSDTALIYHNSITSSSDGFLETFGPNKVRLKNNIFYNTNVSACINLTGIPIIESDNNCFFAPGSNVLALINAIPQSNLSALQTLTGMDANSIAANPVFLSSTNLHLAASSPCIHAGAPVGITVDADGDARNATTPDMGADEFVPTSPINAGISANGNLSFCVGDSVQLNATPLGNLYHYQWMNANVPLTNDTLATLIVHTSGNYTCVINDNTSTDTSNVLVVQSNPLPLANAGADQNVCLGASVILGGNPSGSGLGVISFAWNNAASLSNATSANPTATPTLTTTYVLTVTDGNQCTATDTAIITLSSTAGFTVTITTSNSQCNGINSMTAHTTGASGPLSYAWQPTLGLTAASADSTGVNAGLPGSSTTYSVTVVDSSSMCSSSATQIVTAPNNPIHAGADVAICTGDTTQLLASGGVSYVWNASTALSSLTVANPKAYPTTTTTFIVIGTTANSCVWTDSIIVHVNPKPIADFIYYPNPVCSGSIELFSFTGSVNINGGPVSYQWLFDGSVPDTSTSAFPPMVNYYNTTTNVQTHHPQLTITQDGCSSLPFTTNLDVHPLPVLSLILNSLWNDDSSACAHWFNQFIYSPSGGTLISNKFGVLINGIYQPTTDQGFDTVTYTYTDTIGCSNSISKRIRFFICEGIDEQNKPSIQLQPNPISTSLTLQSSNLPLNQIRICDIVGREILQLNSPQTQLKITTADWLPGIYLVYRNNQMIGKVVKQ